MGIMGIFQFLLGFLKLGNLTNFLSVPTLMGFTAGAATTIMWGQLKDLLGYTQNTYEKVGLQAQNQPIETYFVNMQMSNPTTAALGVSYLILLEIFKKIGNIGASAKGPLKLLFFVKQIGSFIVLLTSMLITYYQQLDKACPKGYVYPYPSFPQPCGVKIIGPNPAGIPPATFPWKAANTQNFNSVISTAIVCTFVGFLESISIDRALAMQTGFKRADASQELIALGFANFFGSIFGAFPVTGSFSRSSVKTQIGARTQGAGLVVATCMAIVLSFLTNLLTYIPNNCIAAIIISALMGLFDFHAVWVTFKTDKRDFALWFVTYILVIFLGIEFGIASSVGISILVLIFNHWVPHYVVLGRIPKTHVFRSVEQYPEAKKDGTHPGILVVRVDAPLWFANGVYVKAVIDNMVAKQEKEEGEKVRFVVWDMTPIPYIDTTGCQEFTFILKDFQTGGVQLVLANPHGSVLRTLERAGLVGRDPAMYVDDTAKSSVATGGWGELKLASGAVGRQWIFASTSEAVATVLKVKAAGFEPSEAAHHFTDVFGNLVIVNENAGLAGDTASVSKWEEVPIWKLVASAACPNSIHVVEEAAPLPPKPVLKAMSPEAKEDEQLVLGALPAFTGSLGGGNLVEHHR